MHSGFVKAEFGQLSVFFRLVNFAIVQLMLFISIYSHLSIFNDTYVMIGLIASVAFSLIAESVQLYRSWRTSHTSRLVLYTLFCWGFAVFVVSAFLFFSNTSADYSRLVIGFWFVISAFALVIWRVVFRYYLFKLQRKGFNNRNVAIIGLTDPGVILSDEFTKNPELGFKFKGFFDDRDVERLPINHRECLQGGVEQCIQLARYGQLDVIYVALPMASKKRIDIILRALGDTTTDVYVLPDFFTSNLLQARLSSVGNVQTVSVYESPHRGLPMLAKRIEDVVAASLILCFIAIPMLIIAMLIKFDSPGPVLFKQKRYGLDGKSVKVWKFRSMTVADNGSVVKQATKGDARITKLGAVLRRTSLDELPQFINVLQGKMSIVGPRPHAVAHNEEYRHLVDFYMLRHKVKPGVTGWAQINGWRGETDTLDKMEKRVEFDLYYIRHWSILLDIKIIFLTVFKGFINKNAY